jgi:putative RNA ligase
VLSHAICRTRTGTSAFPATSLPRHRPRPEIDRPEIDVLARPDHGYRERPFANVRDVPMPTLADIFDANALTAAIDDGYVRVQRHPTLPLQIFNYTEKAQYENVWDAVTLACRGLIAHADGTVIARPMSKFFNYGQTGAPALDASSPVHVTDKADGSLGIMYATPVGWAVATRGSFASDQAIHATSILHTRYPSFTPPDGLTVVVEIIYPSNRIVIDYGDLDDLVLLGAVDIATGRTFGPDAVATWPGPVIERFDHATLAEALAAPPRDNREGFVVWFPSTDVRVKIKYEEYVRLHRIVTGLNARSVWAILAGGDPLTWLVESLPDEFHDWVRSVAATLTSMVDERAAAIEAAYAATVAGLDADWGRKEFALAVARHPERSSLFLRLDDRDYRPLLWQQSRPEPDWTPSGRTFSPDAD